MSVQDVVRQTARDIPVVVRRVCLAAFEVLRTEDGKPLSDNGGVHCKIVDFDPSFHVEPTAALRWRMNCIAPILSGVNMKRLIRVGETLVFAEKDLSEVLKHATDAEAA